MLRKIVGRTTALAAVALALALGGCGGGSDSSGPGSHTLGGSVAGLTANGLVIANGSDTLAVTAGSTSFTMPAALQVGAAYALTVQTQPAGQVCAIAGASGTMAVADVTSAVVTCAAGASTLGGTISGLTGSGLVLANGSDTIAVAANATSFTMGQPVPFGNAYNVTVNTQPAFQACTVSSNSGTMGGSNVVNVAVACSTSIQVSTFAGTSADPAAQFVNVSGVAQDANGNLYVADSDARMIRKITPGGTVSTLAGSGDYGFVDGPGTAAQFRSPSGLALDGSGNVYVADTDNQSIRKIAPDGTVSTLAGDGGYGFVDGPGTVAQFASPTGLAVDGSGNVYVADNENHRIRKIAPDGTVSTLAGDGQAGYVDGPGQAAQFSYPRGVAVDGSGNVYVADSGNNRIRKITPDGTVSTLAGDGNNGFVDGPGATAQFSYLAAVAVDGSGTVYAADSGEDTGSRIRRIASDGTVSTLAGGESGRYYPDGRGDAARFEDAAAVAVGGSGKVYVADRSRVRLISNAVPPISTLLARDDSHRPSSLTRDSSGNLYGASNSQIIKLAPDGTVSVLAGGADTGYADGPGATAQFSSPHGVAVDGAGNVYVADTSNRRIRKVTPDGTVSTVAGDGTRGFLDGPAATAQFDSPVAVAVDGQGTVFVADESRIRKITPDGMVSTLAGSGIFGYQEGPGATAQFASPEGVSVDAGGNVYVADRNNSRIRKIAPDGTVSTLAGSGGYGFVDGPGPVAQFASPTSLAVDVSGNVFVADRSNNRIRKVAPDGTVTTVAGNGTQGGADGSLAMAQLASPQGVAVDVGGNVYAVDDGGIRKIRAAP